MNVLRKLTSTIGTHLSDDTLSRLVSEELTSTRSHRARKHLAKCWKCRSRYEELERAAMDFVELNKQLIPPNPPEGARWREIFLARLDQAATELPAIPWWSRLLSPMRSITFTNMNPFIASVVVIAFASFILFIIWQRTMPSVSANELLERAESSDSHSSHGDEPGVIYQKVRIRTAHRMVERDLYRDREGRRQPKPEPVNGDLLPLKSKLGFVGVDWEEPLSAAAYREWHDHQEVKSDRVEQSGENFVTLITIPANGLVTQESLTIRENDFHPVKRTIELRDTETVEIAEVNYAVLSWSAVNEGLFEPLAPVAAAVRPLEIPSTPPLGATPTPLQLMDAELQSRLLLNHLNADANEQIRIIRTNVQVEVKGIVETEQRKQEILSQLNSVPYLNTSLLSVEELSNHPARTNEATSIQEYSLVGRPSPLEHYMKEKSFSGEDLNDMSHRLLDACLSVRREAGGLSELQDNFGSIDSLSLSSRRALNELMANHRTALLAALDAEAGGLQGLGFIPSSTSSAPAAEAEGSASALAFEAKRNESLCQELITGSEDPSRSAATIASDFLVSVDHVRSISEKLDSRPPKP